MKYAPRARTKVEASLISENVISKKLLDQTSTFIVNRYNEKTQSERSNFKNRNK